VSILSLRACGCGNCAQVKAGGVAVPTESASTVHTVMCPSLLSPPLHSTPLLFSSLLSSSLLSSHLCSSAPSRRDCTLLCFSVFVTHRRPSGPPPPLDFNLAAHLPRLHSYVCVPVHVSPEGLTSAWLSGTGFPPSLRDSLLREPACPHFLFPMILCYVNRPVRIFFSP
jgi:hypothetical protein